MGVNVLQWKMADMLWKVNVINVTQTCLKLQVVAHPNVLEVKNLDVEELIKENLEKIELEAAVKLI